MSDPGDTIILNGEVEPLSGADIRALLAAKGIDCDRGGVAVAVNGEVVPRVKWARTPVKPNDKIEIVNIVRGG